MLRIVTAVVLVHQELVEGVLIAIRGEDRLVSWIAHNGRDIRVAQARERKDDIIVPTHESWWNALPHDAERQRILLCDNHFLDDRIVVRHEALIVRIGDRSDRLDGLEIAPDDVGDRLISIVGLRETVEDDGAGSVEKRGKVTRRLEGVDEGSEADVRKERRLVERVGP